MAHVALTNYEFPDALIFESGVSVGWCTHQLVVAHGVFLHEVGVEKFTKHQSANGFVQRVSFVNQFVPS